MPLGAYEKPLTEHLHFCICKYINIMHAAYADCCMTPMPLSANATAFTSHSPNPFL